MAGEILSEEEQLQQAYELIAKYSAKRGDSFDIGGWGTGESKDLISGFITNPRGIASSLNLTPKQAENIKSLVVGGGTGGVHKLLSQYLGDELAGMIGGLVSGWIAKKILK